MLNEFITLTATDSIYWDIKYSHNGNIVGRKISGYYANKCMMTKSCFSALQKVTASAKRLGYSLLIWDAYRPKKAVIDFWHWSQNLSDNGTKAQYYPNLSKGELFAKGYFNKTSNHCSGSTVDLTLINKSGKELDMGTCFDFMDPLSHPHNLCVSKVVQGNRKLLQGMMIDAGFEPIDTEWWHFRLSDEPFENQMFDFDII
ncbi:M15 family metallopeptidase [Fastidiosibacter lacustris]|uniref:M15 family metallopeptidase n=1 Tax=Fastidiosibacter lacustris TaxID=2056695 RepID=UPI000E343230|nr:M15 family metallopeptidase [Fastidiosibacter lacustris]